MFSDLVDFTKCLSQTGPLHLKGLSSTSVCLLVSLRPPAIFAAFCSVLSRFACNSKLLAKPDKNYRFRAHYPNEPVGGIQQFGPMLADRIFVSSEGGL